MVGLGEFNQKRIIMAITFNENLLGKMVIEQNGNEYEIEIRQGNCLAVFIYKTEDGYGLYNFYADLDHIKRIRKSHEGKLLFYDKVVSCRLNLRYKEAQTLARYFAMDGVEVVGYYE